MSVFPDGDEQVQGGELTVRRLYAGMAMQGLLSNPNLRELIAVAPNLHKVEDQRNLALLAWRMADAMLGEEREERWTAT